MRGLIVSWVDSGNGRGVTDLLRSMALQNESQFHHKDPCRPSSNSVRIVCWTGDSCSDFDDGCRYPTRSERVVGQSLGANRAGALKDLATIRRQGRR
jgi:hypothetical protein